MERVLYVTTNRQREDVLAALAQAGFQSTSAAHETPLVLIVRLGGRRGTRDCGFLRNVTFELRHVGVRIATLKGRGWAGSCGADDILLQMSAELARLFGEPA